MLESWTHETERYRYATREGLPDFVELLSDPEVGRWLWFTPIPPDAVEQYFGPLLDRQAAQLDTDVYADTAERTGLRSR